MPDSSDFQDDMFESVTLSADRGDGDLVATPSGRAGRVYSPGGAKNGQTVACHVHGEVTVTTAQANGFGANAKVWFDTTNRVATPTFAAGHLYLGIPKMPKVANVGTSVTVLLNVLPRPTS